MLLAIDIGNTNLTIGLFESEKLIFLARLSTDKNRTAEQYAVEISQTALLEKKSMNTVTGAIISSVVPELTSEIKRAVFLLTGIVPKVLGPELKNGLDILIDNPSQLGADLVAGAVAAVYNYEMPCLVMDLGTATKISVLDKNGAYRGCTISAGVAISLHALASSASQLPTVDLNIEKCPAFGTNTISSMQAGILLGTASMLDGLCDRIENALGEKIKTVVATGGLSTHITRHCRRELICEPNLILEGLRIIYMENTP
mgnify:CR=1 FL=1